MKNIASALVRKSHDYLFSSIHSRWLIYNTCWEDPRIDRQLLDLKPDSKVVVLTSAGCNTLDYLLDSPAQINCVDVNPRQNALLQLKLSMIEHCDYEDLFEMFGKGKHQKARLLYRSIKTKLPDYARDFWDKKIEYFEHDLKKERTFYYTGAAGTIAWMFSRYLLRKRILRELLFDLIDAKTLQEQEEIYGKLEPHIWGPVTRWYVRRPMVMAMCGVPREQINLIKSAYPGGLEQYVLQKIKHVLTKVLIQDNYFWRVYLTGSYTDSCCPNYLKPENFETLKNNVSSVHPYSLTVTEFLQQHPDQYTHYILLDHQDWMASNDVPALEEEWREILANSESGSKILMRSAAEKLDFLPQFTQGHLQFQPELTTELHQQDRVGTYESLHFAHVNGV